MNSFGRIFRVSIYGESHGEEIGILIDGCPAGITFEINDLIDLLDKRKAGNKGTSSRKEDDMPIIKSGIYNNFTTGSPILITFKNKEYNSNEYDNIKQFARPGHSDYTNYIKYKCFNNPYGGGHSSGRLTLGIVSAGYFAKKIIQHAKISAEIIEINGSNNFENEISLAIKKNDSIGAVIECVIDNIEVGLGEPFFDSVESMLSHIIFAIPAIKGIEFGAGFNSAIMYGSEMNDEIIDSNGKTATNNAGGINGGISNGNQIVFRVAVKPTSSIAKPQNTINLTDGSKSEILISGRHDTCIALRMPVIIESAAAIAIADLFLINKSYI